MSVKKTEVSVLMPVYNGEKYLREAIDSILNQTFSDFELLVINDGSADGTVDIISSYDDRRIRLVHNHRNLGLINTLNRGLELASGRYIARMDADDISEPDRIRLQVVFMDSHPDIGLCGTWFQFMGTNIIIKHPIEHDKIKIKLFADTAFAHPTVMFRKSVLKNVNPFYDPAYAHAEDYEFWIRLAQVTTTANIPQVLLHYRLHETQVSTENTAEQKAATDRIRLKQLHGLGINAGEAEQKLHLSLLAKDNAYFFFHGISWLYRLHAANRVRSVYNERLFALQLLAWAVVPASVRARMLLLWFQKILQKLVREVKVRYVR